MPQPVEAAHDRVEQERDQRRDHEQDHGMTGRRRQHPAEQDEQRQPHELDPARNLDPRRRADRRFTPSIVLPAPPRSGRAVARPAWDWSLAEDGALALERVDAWDDPRAKPLHAQAAATRLKARSGVRYGPADVAAPGPRARRASPCPPPAGRSAAAAGSPYSLQSPSSIVLTVLVTAFGGRGGSRGAPLTPPARVAPAAGRPADGAGDLAARHAEHPAADQPEPRDRDRLLERRAPARSRSRPSARRPTRG